MTLFFRAIKPNENEHPEPALHVMVSSFPAVGIGRWHSRWRHVLGPPRRLDPFLKLATVRPPVRRFLATSAEPTTVTDCPSFGLKVAQVPAEGAKRYMASHCRHGNKTAEDAGGMCRWNEAARTVVGAVCAQMRSFGKESRLAAPLVMRTSCCLPFVCVRAGVCAHPH